MFLPPLDPRETIYSTPIPRPRTPLALIQQDAAEALRIAQEAAILQRRDRLAFLNKRAWARRVAQWAQATAPPPSESEDECAEPYVIYTSRPAPALSASPHLLPALQYHTPPPSPAYTPAPPSPPPLCFSPSPSSESGSDRSASPPSPPSALPILVLPAPRRGERRLRAVPSLSFITEDLEEEEARDTCKSCTL
jgi:hypothetical protein